MKGNRGDSGSNDPGDGGSGRAPIPPGNPKCADGESGNRAPGEKGGNENWDPADGNGGADCCCNGRDGII